MSKTVGQMAREYARDNMPKDFDPEFFDHENPTRFQNRMDEWYQIQIIFKAGYAAAQAAIKAKEKMFDALLIDAKNLSAQVDQLESKLEKAEADTERLNWMIENEKRVLECIGGYFVKDECFEDTEECFETPRDAIDAAMEASKAKGK